MIRRGSSFRESDPSSTLAEARRIASRCGITRVTEITQMDKLGMPVHASIRPSGLTLCVNAGKGLEVLDSQVGAYMEAIEYAVAEPGFCEIPSTEITAEVLSEALPTDVSLVDFCPRSGIHVNASELVQTLSCDSLDDGNSYQLPAQLILLPYIPRNRKNIFGGTTNGLASGNTVDEATLHALLEVIERDVLSFEKIRKTSILIHEDTLPEKILAYAVSWRRKGVNLFVREIPNEYNLPCYQAFIYEPYANDVNLATGSGLHIDSDIALVRAVSEAAQSRLSHIHGGRDDVVRFYSKFNILSAQELAAIERREVDKLSDSSKASAYLARKYDIEVGIEKALSDLLDNLRACGRKTFRFTFPLDAGISVVKTIVSGMEHVDATTKRIGPRFLKELLG